MSLREFTTDRLEFRGFHEEDFDDLFDILGSETVCEHLPVKPAYNKEQVAKVLNYFIKTFVIEKKNLHYIALLKGTDTVVGYGGCSYIDEYKCNEIEYFLKPQFFGNGYASEIAFAMKDVAFSLGLKHLVGLADTRNIPSQKILEKIGYEYQKDVKHWGLDLKLYELFL